MAVKGRYQSIRTKIALGSLIIVAVVWSVLAVLSYSATGALLKLTSEQLFSAAAKEVSLDIQSTYQPVTQLTELLADSKLAEAPDFPERLQSLPLLTDMLVKNPEAVAIQAGYPNGDYYNVRQVRTATVRERLEAPTEAIFTVDHIWGDRGTAPIRQFYTRELELIGAMPMVDTGYDPRIRPWYEMAIVNAQAITTSPYFFYFLRTLGVTVAQQAEEGSAVIATDITLRAIDRYLSERKITPGTKILLHRDGGVIAISGGESNLVGAGESIRQKTLSELTSSPFNILADESMPPEWLIHRESIALGVGNNVELVFAVPEAELLYEFSQIRNKILIYSFVLLILLVPLAWFLASKISRPIRELHAAIANVDKDTFELNLPDNHSRDEVGDLTLALGQMSDALQHYIQDLAAATAARQKLESELDIARRIQMDLVPGGGELTVNLGEDRLYACLRPARAVGGDLYELLALDDGRYFIAVGDVSDKGIPAALFMSRAVALAKLLAPRAQSAADVLAELNNELVKGNDSCMFITLFCGFYQPATGELNFSSAGHNPPVIIENQVAKFIELESGSPIGVFEGADYDNQCLNLEHGDLLCVYTDGITEAFNGSREEFSEGRLLDVLQSDKPPTPVQDRGEHILEAVTAFAAGAAQSDDITLMILGRH